jgi:hypothetical protein
MFGLKFPEGALKDYVPLTYEKYHVLAPASSPGGSSAKTATPS